MAKEMVQQLLTTVSRLKSERKAHEQAIAEIDQAFANLGVQAERGRPGRPAKGRRRKRRKFSTSGKESILQFVKQAPKTGRTGKEIEQRWKKEGRAGSAYNQLGQLVAEKKIKRQNLKGQRGSVYRAG